MRLFEVPIYWWPGARTTLRASSLPGELPPAAANTLIVIAAVYAWSLAALFWMTIPLWLIVRWTVKWSWRLRWFAGSP